MPPNDDPVAKAILELAKVHDRRGAEIAKSLDGIASELKFLGNGQAAGGMGAIEGLAVMIKGGLDTVGNAVSELASVIDHKPIGS